VTYKISVVIPLYNKASHIARAIDSVLNQIFTDFELIVVNDGSTDGGEKIVERYLGERVKLINQVNGGESAARNRGIAESACIYIAFLDADDSWDSDFLEIINQLINAYPEAGGYATHIRRSNSAEQVATYNAVVGFGAGARMLDNYFDCVNSGYFPISSSSVCIKRSVFDQVGLFNEGLLIGADIDMWVKVFLHSGFSISPKYAATYFTDAENRSVERPDFSQQELALFVRLRDTYLSKDLDARSYSALHAWVAKRIHQIIIRLIYQDNKVLARKIYFKNKKSLTVMYRLNSIFRLLLPNSIVEMVKRIRASD
jgi:glycosyltransferase involved in cell wall biosynthesis